MNRALRRSLAIAALSCCAFALPNRATADYFRSDPTRGESTRRLVSPGGVQEECIVPKPLGTVPYSPEEQRVHRELCSYDFHPAGTRSTPGDTTVAMCPKLTSTNPAIEMYAVPPDSSREEFESSECPKPRRSAEQIARFSQSITCSYTPSILAYSQLSRVFGGAGRVPIAIVRTMDKSTHFELVEKGAVYARRRYPSPSTIIRHAWERDWTEAHRNPEGSPSKPFPAGVQAEWLFDADHRLVYGALLKGQYVPSYDDVSGKYSYPTRYETFKQQLPYRRVADPRPIADTIPRSLASAAQPIVQMKDVSDLVLLDYLLNQQDRVGNVHYRDAWYCLDGSSVRTSTSKADCTGSDTVQVKEMVLQDNDCGVAKSNLARTHRWLEGVSHMSPQTYRQLLWLNEQMARPETAEWFRRELLFTERDLASVRRNVSDATAKLRDRCRQGTLHLDLDLEAHLSGRIASDSREVCDR